MFSFVGGFCNIFGAGGGAAMKKTIRYSFFVFFLLNFLFLISERFTVPDVHVAMILTSQFDTFSFCLFGIC